MSIRLTFILILLLAAISISAGLVLYPQLPESMASHWDAAGQANGYSSRTSGVFLMPAIMLGVSLLMLFLPQIDPLRENVAQFRTEYNGLVLVFALFLTYLFGLTITWNLGWQFNFSAMLIPAIGLLFFYVGFLLGRARRNWFIGIRTPWTLSNDEVWKKTHSLAKYLFMAAGIITLLGVFLPQAGIWILLASALLAGFVPVIYSYIIFRQQVGR